MKSKGVAAILALFLGGLGIHKFYLGQSGRGLLYLIFCWTFVPAIIALFEFFGLAFGSQAKFDLKYNPLFVRAAAAA
jgi:TM2 domain-containing membrane protein YozV